MRPNLAEEPQGDLNSPYVFPLRMPPDRLKHAYPSVAAAFDKHDYLYVVRYGENEPELRGSALIMLGNRIGGERVLDQHNIRTGRSLLYRAFGAWRDDHKDEARRLIAEGRKAGGVDVYLDRLSALVERTSFRILVHTRGYIFGHIMELKKLHDLDVILTCHAPAKKVKTLPIGKSLANMVPKGKAVDLVVVYDPWAFPAGAGELGAPVIYVMHDGELAYDVMCDTMHEADWIAVQSTTEMVECGEAYGVDCFTQSHFFPTRVENEKIVKSYADRAPRPIDMYFSGGITQDFYRDKRQRVTPLAFKVDAQFNIRLFEGLMPFAHYQQILKSTRFVPVSVRYSNAIPARSFDLMAHGVINVVDELSAMPYMFSERFACFQTVSHEYRAHEIEKHFHRYDEIIDELMPQVPQLEAELGNLLISNKTRAQRFVRDFLFMGHVIKPGRLPPVVPAKQRTVRVPFNQLHLAGYPTDQLKQLIKITRPKGAGRASHWLRLAIAQIAMELNEPFDKQKKVIAFLEEGLHHHPQSLALCYARGLMLRNIGHYAAADQDFRRVAEDELLLADDDPFPSTLEPLQGAYWIMDARIRARSPDKLVPMAEEREVWRSFALSHRADILLKTLPLFSDAAAEIDGGFSRVVMLAQKAIDSLYHNDAAWRALLRGLYGRFNRGATKCGEDFLQAFDTSIHIDGRMLNDFAPMAIDILTRLNQPSEAAQIKAKLDLFLSRAQFQRQLFFLYPETQPLLHRYNLSHGHLIRR